MATTPDPYPPLGIREQIARIDQLIVAAGKVRLDTRLAPWAIVTTASAAGVALFAAGAPFAKLLLG